MIIMTIEDPGTPFETLGLVRGSMIQSKHIGKDMMAGFKTIVGGELKGYTEMMEESRETATQRMIEQAKVLGADAIVCVRYTSSSIMQGAAEVTAYGTAVKYK
jgi:uncharacterized protein YbjQ (UPF0145 family)